MLTLREQAERAAEKAAQDARPQVDVDLPLPSGETPGIEWSEWAPVAGQFADWATTTAALREAGVREGNPVMVPLVKRPLLFLAVKTGMGLALGRAIDRLNDEAGRARRGGDYVAAANKQKWARRISGVFTLLGAGPAINNAAIIARKRGSR